MSLEASRNQRSLWEIQHATRGAVLECGSGLRYTPNDTALAFARRLTSRSRVLEVGSANGRDARHWAAEGHQVIATDFSLTAMKQLRSIAQEQGVMQNIWPVVWDINVGHLPIEGASSIDAFYARSALHVTDSTMTQVAASVNAALVPKGWILIEGKGPSDKKIARSYNNEDGTAVDADEGGHMRRIWTPQFTEQMCHQFGWDIVELTDQKEEWQGVPASFMRLLARKKGS